MELVCDARRPMLMKQRIAARAMAPLCRLKRLWLVGSLAAVALAACGSSSGEAVDGPVMRYPSSSGSGDGMDGVIRGVLELDGECLYVARDVVGERYPILWPSGTEWDADNQSVVTSGGESMPIGGEVLGGGGFLYLDAVDRLAGSDAADLARACVGNTSGQIAIVNNSGSAIGQP